VAQIDPAKRQIKLKVVLWGPGMSGRTTFLEAYHGLLAPNCKGELTSIATEGDRTLFFDALPRLQQVTFSDAMADLNYQLFTVPGACYYQATKKVVLRGADGVLFVADSQAAKLPENTDELERLRAFLGEQGVAPDDFFPESVVFAWNKRDLPSALPVEQLEQALNPTGLPSVEASFAQGVGVREAFDLIAERVTTRFAREYGLDVVPVEPE
jgi:mutual gliding-motility protein MglA